MSFVIWNQDSRVVLGIYKGATEAEAIAAMDEDAGYTADKPNPNGHDDLRAAEITDELEGIDVNLAADIGADISNGGWTLHEYRETEITSLQIVHNPEAKRAGCIITGSGSSGATFWTDCDDLDDARRRFAEDDLRN